MSSSPASVEPPIVELVLGVQFSPLAGLASGHFGRFWGLLGDEWAEPGDAPPLEDQFELFDRPFLRRASGPRLRLEPMRLPGRFLVSHRANDRLIQVQSTRFHLNWRKRPGVPPYPRYHQLITEFENAFDRFRDFAGTAGLGAIVPNQWEITYVDAFPEGDLWRTAADWSAFLPGLFGVIEAGEGLTLEYRSAEWVFEIPPQRGRLHVSAQPGRSTDDQRPSLLLQMTARGPIGKDGAETLRAGLDLGHRASLETFRRVVSPDAQERWRTHTG